MSDLFAAKVAKTFGIAAPPKHLASFATTVIDQTMLIGQRHFGVDRRGYKPEARASEFGRKVFTRLRFGLVLLTKVALSN